MKNLKPFLLGSLAGCGAMFLALQYHVVQSHDGLQLVPRAPQVSLGLAWADIRHWDAETWAERPEVARALVAHGSSDLISESVARAIADSSAPDAGTIDQLRSLLNGSMSSEFDAPLFEEDRGRDSGQTDDDLMIPFMQGTRGSEWGDPFTMNGSRSRTGSHTDTGFSDLDDVISEETERRTQDRYARQTDHTPFDPFSQVDSAWQSRRSPETSAESRRRDTTILEDLLFSDDDDTNAPAASMDSAMRQSRFDSLTRALDSRASQALDLAGSDLRDNSSPSPGGTNRYAREIEGPAGWTMGNDRESSVPHAVRALRDGFDPFNDSFSQ